MRVIANRSIRGKLMWITMLTSTGAVILACLAFGVYELINYRQQMSRDLSVLSEMIERGADRRAGDIRSGSSQGGKLLGHEATVRSFSLACTARTAGCWSNTPANDVPRHEVPELLGDDIDRIEGGHLVLYQPILLQGQKGGDGVHPLRSALALPSASLEDLRIVAIILLSSWLVALLLASRLQNGSRGQSSISSSPRAPSR